MADIKLFNIEGQVEELQSKQVTLEKELIMKTNFSEVQLPIIQNYANIRKRCYN